MPRFRRPAPPPCGRLRLARVARVARVALGAFALAVGGPASEALPDDAKTGATPPRPRTFALLIGCTEYPELRKASASEAVYRAKVRLGGCVNDVEAMTTALVDRLGVRREDIVALAGWPDDAAARPTEANVRAALVALAARKFEQGDRVIVHYSGHGVQLPDEDGDETDGLDEAWLLADGRKDPSTAYAGTLRDDELGERLRAIRDRAASVWCVMDCCHSATGMRGASDPQTRTRGLDPAVVNVEVKPASAGRAPGGHQDSPMDDARRGTDGIVVFYAAQSFQEVPEVRMPERGASSKPFGLLTSAVLRALERSGTDSTYEGLYEQVVACYRDLGMHHRVQPLAEGDLGQRVSGGAGAPAALFVRNVGSGLELSAGALSGFAEGTEFEILAPQGAAEGAPALGRVVLTDVRAERATVAPVAAAQAAWAKDAAGAWPARVAKYVVGETTLPLAVTDEANRPVALDALPEGVRQVLDGDLMKARFPRETDATRARWALVVGAGREPIALTPSVRGRAAPRFDVDADTLEAGLLTIYRGENLLKLCARDPDGGRLPGNLELEIRRRGSDGKPARVRAGERVLPGSRLDFELIKTAARARADVETMDVFVFWIDPHYGVTMLYPDRGNSPRLVVDDVSREGKGVRVGAAEGEETSDVSQGEERIVVFASAARTPALRLDFLEQPPLTLTRGATSGPRDGVALLLDDLDPASAGTRGVRKVVDRAGARLYSKVFTFETRWNGLRAPPDAKDQPSARIDRPPTAPVAGAPPDAWRLGPEVRLARVGDDGAWCMLVAREDGPAGATSVLVDLDDRGPEVVGTKEGLASVVKGRTFDAELAVRIERAPKRVLVWYDTDDDGTFDRLLIDADDDLRAEERHRLVAGTWVHDVGIDAPLLSTWNLTWIADDGVRSKAIGRLRALAGD